MSYKTGMFALVLAAACALVVLAHLSPWVLVALLGTAALLCAAAAFRREQHKVDRILFEELDPVDDHLGAPVEVTNRPSTTAVSRLGAHPTRHLHRAS